LKNDWGVDLWGEREREREREERRVNSNWVQDEESLSLVFIIFFVGSRFDLRGVGMPPRS